MMDASVPDLTRRNAGRSLLFSAVRFLTGCALAALVLTSGLVPFELRGEEGLKKKSADPRPKTSKTAPGADGDPLTPESGEAPERAEPIQRNGDEEPALGGKPWLASMNDGFKSARQSAKPLFVRGGATWCKPCRQLNEVLAKPEVQDELAKWTLVYLDVDKVKADAEGLGMQSIPSLHILSSTGKPIASRQGLLTADELVEWLQQNHKAALAAAPTILIEDQPLGEKQVPEIVAFFGHRDAVVREAAIRRLLKLREMSAEAVVETFSDGKLAARLSAFELLTEWKAPLNGLDPWRPETLTKAKLTQLSAWGAAQKRMHVVVKQALTPEELQEAKELIAKMVAANAADTATLRERIARHRELVLPLVRAEHQKAETDDARERLLALRYRLVASETLALGWPQGLERLASTDTPTRQNAAAELAKRAGTAEEMLLREMFSDPAPLVREISLRTLRQHGGTQSLNQLIDLLSDPEPNVRAAVLKVFVESPPTDLIPRIIEYTKTETDPDLLVHAVRVLRDSQVPATLDALTKLSKHESWRVRAEAAEGIGKVATRHSNDNDASRADAYAALIALLDDTDGFVISRAVSGLAHADLATAVEPLAKAAEKHPELATEVLKALASGSNQRAKALPHLQRFAKHSSPALRAGAIQALSYGSANESIEELKAAVKDPSAEVRIAAARGIYVHLYRQEYAMTQLSDQMEASPAPVPAGGEDALEEAVPAVPEVEKKSFTDKLWNLFKPKKEAPAAKPVPAPPGQNPPPVIPPDAKPLNELPLPPGSEAPAVKPGPPQVERILHDPPLPRALPRQPPLPSGAPQPFPEIQTVKQAGPQSVIVKKEGVVIKSTVIPLPRPVPDGPEVKAGAAAADLKDDDAEPVNAAEEYLLAVRKKEKLPKWMFELTDSLKPMLKGETSQERLAGGVILVALGQEGVALPVLRAEIKTSIDTRTQVAAALPWLLWNDRVALFRELIAAGREHESEQFLEGFTKIQDRRALPILWELIARKDLDEADATRINGYLRKQYLGPAENDQSKMTSRRRRFIERDVPPRAKTGSTWQRLTALFLLKDVDKEQAVEIAQGLATDKTAGEPLQRGALALWLTSQVGTKGTKTVVDLINDPQMVGVRKLCLLYLAHGAQAEEFQTALQWGSQAHGMQHYSGRYYGGSSADTQVGTVEAPPGLAVEPLLPLLKDPDAETRALAGYLLTLLERPEGLTPLLDYWKKLPADDQNWSRLVYRAIVALNDETRIGLLTKIYSTMDAEKGKGDVRDFYWTIRGMGGPEMLKLRKRIRDEVGMERLGR